VILRPASTRWFEVLCARRDSVRVAAELAATGAIEVEIREHRPEDSPVRDLGGGLATYASLVPRYARYWARGTVHRSPLASAPAVVLARALEQIAAWRRDADPLIASIQECEDQLGQLQHLQRILHDLSASALDFDLVTGAGPALATFCGFLPLEAEPEIPPWTLYRSVPWEDERCILVVGPASRIVEAQDKIKVAKGRIIERPSWLRGDVRKVFGRVNQEVADLRARLVMRYAELDDCFEEHGLGEVLGDVESLQWFARNIGRLELASDLFVWITGWTSDLRGKHLMAALEATRSPSLLRFSAPPAGFDPPRIYDNPKWLRPFEIFARVLGVPGNKEVDPTPVVGVVVPVLFGYMFGDVGHGLVLAAVGWWLRNRYPVSALLLPGGLSAAIFGLLFGSVFGVEGLIPALWLHPLDEPIHVLSVPLIFGVLLLSLGQLLRALGALWSGDLRSWLAVDGGFLVLYLGGLASLFSTDLWPLAAVGSIWYLVGAWWLHGGGASAFAALGHLVESGLQIVVNTLSFARVGAFALAHAALSLAMITLAGVPDSLIGSAMIVVFGNLLVIVLEGLVVSIQTTRLVLFEFFVRFLQGGGRVFRPLQPPPPWPVTGSIGPAVGPGRIVSGDLK